MRSYILVSQDLRQLCADKCIDNVTSPSAQIQPASMDLCLGDFFYSTNSSFLPGTRLTVSGFLRERNVQRQKLAKEVLLKRGQVYIFPLREHLNLPKYLYGLFNPKSSTGRLDVFARTVGDYADRFDYVPSGYQGPLYVELYSSSFDIIVSPGLSLNQLRIQQGNQVQLSAEEMTMLKTHEDIDNEIYYDCERGLVVLLSLANHDEPVGYCSKLNSMPINLRYINHYSVEDFWRPIYNNNQEITIEPGGFYILRSHNNIMVPSYYAGHMLPYDIESGEFRAHYAGFFDPGFGAKEAHGLNAKAIMEIRCRDVPFLLKDRQVIGRLIYQRLHDVPDILYGKIGSHYQGQQLRLSKHFIING